MRTVIHVHLRQGEVLEHGGTVWLPNCCPIIEILRSKTYQGPTYTVSRFHKIRGHQVLSSTCSLVTLSQVPTTTVP